MGEYLLNYTKRATLWVADESKGGVAYAVLDSPASRNEVGAVVIEEMERTCREDIKGPGKLEIAVVAIPSVRLKHNPEMHYFIHDEAVRKVYDENVPGFLREKGKVPIKRLKYAVQLSMPNRTDRELAGDLNRAMEAVEGYYGNGEVALSAVVYRNPRDKFLDFKPNKSFL